MNMASQAVPPKPSSDEIVAAEKLGREFLRKIAAVPEGDRKPLLSDKFAGPIAQEVVGGGSSEVPDGEEDLS
jgi:hypothetical protein